MEARPLDALPDLPLHTVLAHLDAASLREARAVSRGLRDAASDDALWAGALRADYGDAAAAYVLGPSFAALRCNWARHAAWSVVARRASTQTRAKLEVASTAARVNQGPVFCVASLGDGAFVAAGGGPDITIVRREASAPVDVRAAHTNATSAFSVSAAPLPNPAALAVDGEWDGHEEGMLGMSYDAGTGTLVAGSFGGRLRAWRLNYAELRRLESLPAKRLRAILAAKGVPTDDIHERSEYLERIRTYRALPLAAPVAPSFDATYAHVGSVVGVSHAGDVVVSGANDGHARVWRLSTGKCVASLGHAGAPLPPPADGGAGGGFQTAGSIDSVLYTPATGLVSRLSACAAAAGVWGVCLYPPAAGAVGHFAPHTHARAHAPPALNFLPPFQPRAFPFPYPGGRPTPATRAATCERTTWPRRSRRATGMCRSSRGCGASATRRRRKSALPPATAERKLAAPAPAWTATACCSWAAPTACCAWRTRASARLSRRCPTAAAASPPLAATPTACRSPALRWRRRLGVRRL
jgi:hypothetical protein